MIQPGLYGPRELLGAKVRIISSPPYNLFDNSQRYFIEKIEFRLDPDGKMRAGILLEGLPNSRFLPEDLCVLELSECGNVNKNPCNGKENQENKSN